MDKTRIYICLILLALTMSLSSCNERNENTEVRTRFHLQHPDSRQGGTCGLRFSNAEEKDERTLAYEKLAEEWNRNLILGQRQCRQYDYEEEPVSK